MITAPPDTVLKRVTVFGEDDLSRVRRAVAHQADAHGCSDLDRTRLVTASSELSRNMLRYAGGGLVTLERVNAPSRLRISFEDSGPGIVDLERALEDGYSTGKGLGLGLSGARRLVDHFSIDSRPGDGTRIAIERHLSTNFQALAAD